jgi:hypothetical protein
VTGPRIYFPPGTSDDERVYVESTLNMPPKRRQGSVAFRFGLALASPVVHYSAAEAACTDCDCRWQVWIRANGLRDALDHLGLLPEDHPLKQCPLCHPDPTELDKAGRIELARALAQTDALDTMHVLLDQALNEGRTSEAQFHNPDDLAEIVRLRFERDQLADLIAQRDEDLEAARADRTAGIRDLIQQQSTLGETRWSDAYPPRSR